MAGTYYFLTTARNAIAYDYDDSENTTRNSSKDRNLSSIISGSVTIRGATATDNRIAILSNDTIHILDHNWNRVSREDVSLTRGKSYDAIAATDTEWVVFNNTDDRLEFWTFAGSETTSKRQAYGSDVVIGLFADDTYIYIINNTDSNVQRRTYTSTTLSTFISNIGNGAWQGGTSTPSRFVLVEDRTDDAHFYNHSGAVQASEEIDLPSGAYRAAMAIEDEASATLTLSTTDTDIRPNEQVNINIVSDIDISDFAATDITVRNGTRGTLTRTDARNYVLSVTAASSAGTMTVSIAADVVSPGNAAVSQNFTINPNPVVASDLVVSITGTTNIVQFQRTTLTAAVTDADSNAITSGLTYAWTASRGRFIGATNEASAVYEANFTDSSDVEATITCAVTLAADAMPTSDGASLTALSDIGVTGVLVNMFMTALGAVVSNANNALYQDGGAGTLDSGSDQQLDTNIKIWRVRWNNSSNRIILNNNQTGSLQTYFTTNTDKSLYVVFEDGTYVELPQSQLVSTGTTWAQWSVTDANIVAKLNALTTTSDLTIGVADADAIGFDANSGSGTATVTATPIPTPAAPTNFTETHTHNSATLSWTSLAGETYEVRQGSNAWSDATSPHTVSGLSPSTAYTFQVRVKAKGRTPAGDAASINLTTNAAPLIAPSVPASLSATTIDHDSVRLSYTASTGTVTQYQYRYATSTVGLSSAVWTNGGTGTTIDVDGLTPSTQYYFQVRACNQTVYSAASNTANATTQAAPLPAPSVPGSLSATAVDHDTIRLTFSASTGTVTQYQYKVATSSAGLSGAAWNNGGTATTINVDGLTPSTQYYFQVRALNQTVGSAASNTADATTQAPPLVAPSVPGSFAAAVVDHDTVRLAFSASTGTVTQYQYRYATSSAALSGTSWTDGGTGTTINVDGLSPSTLYYFQVRACNQTVYSAATSAVTATTTQRVTGPLAIEAVSSPLDILINTPYELRVNITGNPTDVQVRGDLQFWDYEWNDPQLRLWVTFRLQVTNKSFTIYAVDPNDSTNIIQQTVTYNVVLPAPIIEAITLPPIVKGYPYRAFVPIVNSGNPTVEGLFTGTGYYPYELEHSNAKGVLILGNPADVDRSVTSGMLTLRDESDRHIVTKNFPFDIEDVSYDNIYAISSIDNKVYAFPKNIGISQANTTSVTPTPVFEMAIDQYDGNNTHIVVLKNSLFLMTLSGSENTFHELPKNNPYFIPIKTFVWLSPKNSELNPGGVPTVRGFVSEINGYGNMIIGQFRRTTDPIGGVAPAFIRGINIDNLNNDDIVENSDFQFQHQFPISIYDVAIDDMYIYGIGVSGASSRIVRMQISDGMNTGSIYLNGAGFIDVDDTYLYFRDVESGTHVIERYLKSGLIWDNSLKTHTGAKIIAPTGKNFIRFTVTSASS